MSKQKLVMKYHPAKKEVEFHRFQKDKEVPIRSDSCLALYMNKKGNFVLQDQGKEFFDNIAKAFDGLKTVDIDVITTKLDYDDFKEMVEHYNTCDSNGLCSIRPSLVAELPDMKQTFREVMKHGEDSIAVLEKHKQYLYEMPLEKKSVRESAKNFALQIDNEIKHIREKMDSLCDNTVSLCFTGVYSSGKSALINAILGYRILPEDIKSETAKMFQISSPKNGEPVKISFQIMGIFSELQWNGETKCFEFVNGPAENPVRNGIQTLLYEIKGLVLHDQIQQILKQLNACMEVGATIRILFPVPLDNENVQFTLYDTPGTDSSNSTLHHQILEGALAEQTQSILIFVATAGSIEASGNNMVLNYLKEAEQKNQKTSIDMNRSLFVINQADSNTASNREKVISMEIKDKSDEKSSIQLDDVKLFFTSAMYAYAARAVKNEIATQEDQSLFEGGKYLMSNEKSPMSCCFKQDKCASSEVGTERIQNNCQCALEAARSAGDDSEILIITSGLYALEREIVEYGEKYASAVKAHAIIDGVDKALVNLSTQANTLKELNNEKISYVEEQIEVLRNTISEAINKEYEKKALPKNEPLTYDIAHKLQIDSDSLQKSIIGKTKKYIDNTLTGGFLGLGNKIKVKEEDKKKVQNYIEKVMYDFKTNFTQNRDNLLQEQNDQFREAVIAAIENNGKIDKTVKKVFKAIPKNKVSIPPIKDISSIYDKHKDKKRGFLFIKKEYLDKEGFIKDIEKMLIDVARDLTDMFSKDYRDSLERVLMNIRGVFESNLATYSLQMKGMIEDRKSMIKLGEQVADAANSLEQCQQDLDKTIWKEIKND